MRICIGCEQQLMEGISLDSAVENDRALDNSTIHLCLAGSPLIFTLNSMPDFDASRFDHPMVILTILTTEC